jgi:splicing factor 45
LRFQPTKRPQIASQKAKAKAIAAKFAPPSSTSPVPALTQTESTEDIPTTAPTPQPSAPRTTAADWIATASDDEDVNNYYAAEKRQRGGRKKRKKNKEAVQIVQDWDDIYDPSRPNNYEEYKHSEEKIREVREWKDLLYRHRIRRRGSSESEEEDRYRLMNSKRSKETYLALLTILQNNSHHLPCRLLRLQISTKRAHLRLQKSRTTPLVKMLTCVDYG